MLKKLLLYSESTKSLLYVKLVKITKYYTFIAYLILLVMLFVYMIELNVDHILLFFIKGLIFNVYTCLFIASKLILIIIKTLIFIILKAMNVILERTLFRMGVSLIFIENDLCVTLTGNESIFDEFKLLLINIAKVIYNFNKLFSDLPDNFDDFRQTIITIDLWLRIIFMQITDTIDYFGLGVSQLTYTLIPKQINSVYTNIYCCSIDPLAKDQLLGEITIIKLFFYKYQTPLISFFLVLLFLQTIFIAYYSIFKNINYKKALNFMSVLLFIQVHTTIVLYILNFNFVYISPWTTNSHYDLFEVFTLKLDKLSFTFIFTVYLIGFFVHAYQFLYLYDTPNKEKFLVSINLFIISMLLIVFSANWLLLLLAWEILGQSSFFLISFFKNKPSAFKSGYKAFFFNKISDITLIVAFVFYYKIFQRFEFLNISELTLDLKYVGVLILVTAFIKSAQFFFYFWLPDSMEAPVPASALIHSATLVSAGIYLCLRFIQFIESNELADLCLIISAPITMILASAMALNQTDIKRLLAYSTISNCAFIYFILLSKNYELTYFYFVLHGVIKSLSFLIAGFLIQQQNHNQDFRNWELKNKNEIFAVLLLSLTLLILATLPISITYNIKNNINALHGSNTTLTLYLTMTLVLYSINSYMYGLKIILFLLNRKFYLIKIRKQEILNFRIAFSVIKIITIYYIYILVILITLHYTLQTNIINIINLQWVVVIIVSSVLLIYTHIQLNRTFVLFLITLLAASIVTLI